MAKSSFGLKQVQHLFLHQGWGNSKSAPYCCLQCARDGNYGVELICLAARRILFTRVLNPESVRLCVESQPPPPTRKPSHDTSEVVFKCWLLINAFCYTLGRHNASRFLPIHLPFKWLPLHARWSCKRWRRTMTAGILWNGIALHRTKYMNICICVCMYVFSHRIQAGRLVINPHYVTLSGHLYQSRWTGENSSRAGFKLKVITTLIDKRESLLPDALSHCQYNHQLLFHCLW